MPSRNSQNEKAPASKITDLDTPVAPIIKSIPVVKDVRVTGPAQPTKRIIHICDWHLVPKDAFHIDQEHVRGKPATKTESDRSYREFVYEVAAVQAEQMALLRMLRCHGINEVFSEGFAVGEEPMFQARIDLMHAASKQVGELRSKMADVREFQKTATGPDRAKGANLEVQVSEIGGH